MKLKTFEDKRTFTEKTGILPERFTDWPNYEISIVTPEEQTARENRIKPPPDHHFFDIQTGSLDIGKAPERVFMEALFSYYWQFKTNKIYNGKHLYKFTVRDFCQHHEVEKNDLQKITLASYEVAHLYQSAWQTDRYRAEILQQIELYLKERPAKKPPKGLEQMFADSNNLQRLVKLLKKHEYIIEKNGKHFWKRQDNEFAAMAKVCTPLLKPEHRENGRKLHIAWTDYFSHETKERIVSEQYFKTEKSNEVYKLLDKFSFIEQYFGIE
ncbi:MAG: hypothetical protein EOM06_13190 [Sphingobacteriia bacterium]|nr:hypothetical protein [Sphingobacteriia bacterium]